MNHRAVLRSLGIVLLAEAGCMIPSLIIALYYKEGDTSAFALTMAILVIAGLALVQFRPAKKGLYARDGLAIVSLGWIGLSLFGAMPFYFSGEIPVMVDAIFESVSGFTTTGASILTDVESLSKGLVFWRSFTHWIGGMGVLLLTLAILPLAGA
ncbi:MAG: TrkH family potassium uptake protein, partial [Clostridiaceae bacterium]|nr:TrkH family potassium uptake protein [Clostridiaceae bacterium]